MEVPLPPSQGLACVEPSGWVIACGGYDAAGMTPVIARIEPSAVFRIVDTDAHTD
jgi:hypothetical protein